MNLKSLCTIVAATAAFTFAGVAGAQVTFTWNGSSSASWKDTANWTMSSGTNRYPGDNPSITDDRVVIRVGGTHDYPSLDLVADGNIAIEDLTIEDDGKLTVLATGNNFRLVVTDALVIEPPATSGTDGRLEVGQNGVLELAASADDPVIGGDLVLTTSTSKVYVMDDMTFGPYNPGGSQVRGFVIGQHDDAEIRIAAGEKLTTQITVGGNVKIVRDGVGTAAFRNEYEVLANAANGTLQLGANVDLEDTSGALWGASASGAELQFHKSAGDVNCVANQLLGDFLVSDLSPSANGSIRYMPNVLVVTEGDYSGDVDDLIMECNTFFGWKWCSGMPTWKENTTSCSP